ncbi:hypothetical protein LAZ67_8003162 [Cordylochernes scorpioides]|uniref:Uncharacterized protein n=1 Tax=Cordylochernes scorpioides TaxID=51811 RepID=A0ABY6KWF8_9ARAC|nr:hypothetical protein LAZ67_8003162 [Cordylochernes scorpioides]
MRLLDHVSKSGSAKEECNVRMAAVDQGTQQNGRTERLSERLSQHRVRRYLPSNVPLVWEAFSIVGRSPDLRGWIFRTGLEDDELAILASAKSRIYRYIVQTLYLQMSARQLSLEFTTATSRIVEPLIYRPGSSGLTWWKTSWPSSHRRNQESTDTSSRKLTDEPGFARVLPE